MTQYTHKTRAPEDHFHVLMLPRRMVQVQRGCQNFLLSVSVNMLKFGNKNLLVWGFRVGTRKGFPCTSWRAVVPATGVRTAADGKHIQCHCSHCWFVSAPAGNKPVLSDGSSVYSSLTLSLKAKVNKRRRGARGGGCRSAQKSNTKMWLIYFWRNSL